MDIKAHNHSTAVKPTLGFWQIWNMCFGFMGIQFGFELQVGNVSRIFQTLGANIDDIAFLWVAAPLTGLIVQPIIGYFSDKTWTSLGRRRPYFLWGAIFSTLALFFMPNSPALWMAAGMLWIMDASLNVAMEPFRAFVGDMLPNRQRSFGFAMQTFFIGIGASVAGALPWVMTNWLGVSNQAAAGVIPDSVIYAFYAGGSLLLVCVLWTVYATKEYSPEELDAFEEGEAEGEDAVAEPAPLSTASHRKGGLITLAVGLILSLVLYALTIDWRFYILTLGLAGFGGLRLWAAALKGADNSDHGIAKISDDIMSMPTIMKQLAVVQFFSWFAMFAMWTYTTPAVTAFHFGATDAASALYNEGADWASLLGSVRNAVTILAAIFIALFVAKLGRRKIHMVNLWIGSAGFASFYFVTDPTYLLISMGLVGFAWASILSIPYALLSGAVPHTKMGTYMGIFNMTIVIPQIVTAVILGPILREIFNGQAIYGLMLSAACLFIAGLLVLFVNTAKPENLSSGDLS